MKENAFRDVWQKRLKARYGDKIYIQKNHGSAFSAGLPDLQLCMNGRWVAVELKAVPKGSSLPVGEPTALQRHMMNRIVGAGGRVAVVALFGGIDGTVGVWAGPQPKDAIYRLPEATGGAYRADLEWAADYSTTAAGWLGGEDVSTLLGSKWPI